MSRCFAIPMVIAPVFLSGCAARVTHTEKPTGTLAELRNVRPDERDGHIEKGLEQALQQYRRFLDETPESAMTPEAIRRLADLQIEKQFGRPEPAKVLAGSRADSAKPAAAASLTSHESDQDFERRTTAQAGI